MRARASQGKISSPGSRLRRWDRSNLGGRNSLWASHCVAAWQVPRTSSAASGVLAGSWIVSLTACIETCAPKWDVFSHNGLNHCSNANPTYSLRQELSIGKRIFIKAVKILFEEQYHDQNALLHSVSHEKCTQVAEILKNMLSNAF